MQEEYKNVHVLLENNLLLQLELPEDKNFIERTKSFQDEIKKLDQKLELSLKLIKNIHFISSELIQATIHNGVFKNELFTNNIKLAYTDNKFYLLSQNLVDIKNIPRIQLKFDEVNSAFEAEDSEEELKSRYKYRLKNAPTIKRGISVGVLDLARRSLNKILYDFKELDDNFAVFSIICTVDVD